MKVFFLVFCTLLASNPLSAYIYNEYSWREYKGVIPPDALVAGKTSDGHEIFIAQVYVHNVGVLVGELHRGQLGAKATFQGRVYNEVSNIKILCGVPYKLYWSRHEQLDMKRVFHNGKAVIGGNEKAIGEVIYIGRIRDSRNHIRIGKVNPLLGEFYYEEQGYERSSEAYDVLVYSETYQPGLDYVLPYETKSNVKVPSPVQPTVFPGPLPNPHHHENMHTKENTDVKTDKHSSKEVWDESKLINH